MTKADRRPNAFTAVKVFTATLAKDRDDLGDKISAWLAANPIRIVDRVVVQSSAADFHCVSILLFYDDAKP